MRADKTYCKPGGTLNHTRRLLLAVFSLSILILFRVNIIASDYVAIEEHLGTCLPEDLVFTTEDERQVRLLDLIDKPAVIVPVYYNCPGLCSPVMDGIAILLNRSELVIGKDFEVINISFHEKETPELARLKKMNYVELLNDPQGGNYWHFMTGDTENIKDLLEALGYSVIRQGEDILHPAAIMVVSPQGKIVKYLQGTKFNPVEFKMAVRQASAGKTMPSITRILKICVNYEPAGRHKQKMVTILGFIVMISIAIILIVVHPPLKNKN